MQRESPKQGKLAQFQEFDAEEFTRVVSRLLAESSEYARKELEALAEELKKHRSGAHAEQKAAGKNLALANYFSDQVKELDIALIFLEGEIGKLRKKAGAEVRNGA